MILIPSAMPATPRPRVVLLLVAVLLLTSLVAVPIVAASPDAGGPGAGPDLVVRDDAGAIHELNRPDGGGEAFTTIGANHLRSNIWLPDEGIHPDHAAISVTPHGIMLKSMSKGAPTFVNGAPLDFHTPERVVRLQVGDRIDLGVAGSKGGRLRFRRTLHLLTRDLARQPLAPTMGVGELAVATRERFKAGRSGVQLAEDMRAHVWPFGFSEPKPAISQTQYLGSLRAIPGGWDDDQGGRIRWLGRRTARGAHKPGDPRAHFYFNVPPTGAGLLVLNLQASLGSARLPFTVSALRSLADARARADVVVLDVPVAAAARVMAIVRRLAADIGTPFDEGYPALTKPVAKGIAVALDPEPGRAFPYDMLRLVGDGIIMAQVGMHPDDPVALGLKVTAVLTERGVDPYHPWGNTTEQEPVPTGAAPMTAPDERSERGRRRPGVCLVEGKRGPGLTATSCPAPRPQTRPGDSCTPTTRPPGAASTDASCPRPGPAAQGGELCQPGTSPIRLRLPMCPAPRPRTRPGDRCTLIGGTDPSCPASGQGPLRRPRCNPVVALPGIVMSCPPQDLPGRTRQW